MFTDNAYRSSLKGLHVCHHAWVFWGCRICGAYYLWHSWALTVASYSLTSQCYQQRGTRRTKKATPLTLNIWATIYISGHAPFTLSHCIGIFVDAIVISRQHNIVILRLTTWVSPALFWLSAARPVTLGKSMMSVFFVLPAQYFHPMWVFSVWWCGI